MIDNSQVTIVHLTAKTDRILLTRKSLMISAFGLLIFHFLKSGTNELNSPSSMKNTLPDFRIMSMFGSRLFAFKLSEMAVLTRLGNFFTERNKITPTNR